MAVNVLEFAKITQKELDKQAVADATSGWMELNSSQVRYSGGDEVKIPKLDMDGLSYYDRDAGFTRGSVKLDWETRKLTMDRGKTFMLDAMDVDETGFVATASAVIGEFQRRHVVPEVDAYRYSAIAALAETKSRVSAIAPDTSNILTSLTEHINSIYDSIGETPLVITMPFAVAKLLEQSSEISRKLDVVDFTQGDLHTKVTALNGIPIIKVPSARMKTKYEFGTNGFTAAADAKGIDWIISSRDAIIAISKTDKLRVFEPNVNQDADAWKIDFRKYHDLWILDNQFDKIWVNTH